MVARDNIRAHGQTTAEDEVREATKDADNLPEVDPPKPLNLTRAFQRMKTDWTGDDRDIINRVKHDLDEIIMEQFADAFAIMFDIYALVRKPVMSEEGEITVDLQGFPEWERNRDGSIVEDWDKLNSKSREKFLYQIITRMFEWEQTAAGAWGEALFAKTQWEEAFATGFESITNSKATIQDRDARGRRLSAEHRYLAVYKAYLSRKADAVVRSMGALSQRLKDIHVN